MGEQTNIAWCDHTFNPYIGCTKVSAGCKFCYAERENKLYRWVDQWGPQGERKRTSLAYWRQPLLWNAAAKREGIRRKVFCGSLCDVFENRPELSEIRIALWMLIEGTPNLDWLLLTKRPENIERMLPERWAPWFGTSYPPPGLPRNIWFGFSAENQDTFDERYSIVESWARLWRPAIIFVSVEPMLGSIDLVWALREHNLGDEDHDRWTRPVDWIICGGETGPQARPIHPDWARKLRDDAHESSTPYFFKQWGEFAPASGDLRGLVCQIEYGGPNDYKPALMARVGKKAAGDLLDGRQHHEFPQSKGA